MNKYLKASSETFEKIKQKDYLLSPISIVDCEIMIEIVELFKKADMRDVVEILKNYKFHKDEDVRDQLMQCNIDFSREQYDSEDDDTLDPNHKDKSKQRLINTIKKLEELLNKKTKFITINNDKIEANIIFGYKKIEHYDVNDNFIGSLILNPVDKTSTKFPLYSNYELKFYDEEEFQEAIENLENQLKECDIKFVNEIIAEKEKQDKDDGRILSGESDTNSTD